MAEPLYTADEMRAAEERYPGFPESAGELRERAGGFVAAQVRARYIAAHRVTVVCGAGSNGGDGRIAAEVLREEEFEVHVVDESGGWLGEPDVVVDALFGTGFHGEPRPDAVRLIESMNDAGVPFVAVDVPSGVNASTGEVAGIAVRADTTVT
ncbi:MAG: NAD(P)H-hydrate epimerase, partial [Gaiellaceae bacterium]